MHVRGIELTAWDAQCIWGCQKKGTAMIPRLHHGLLTLCPQALICICIYTEEGYRHDRTPTTSRGLGEEASFLEHASAGTLPQVAVRLSQLLQVAHAHQVSRVDRMSGKLRPNQRQQASSRLALACPCALPCRRGQTPFLLAD